MTSVLGWSIPPRPANIECGTGLNWMAISLLPHGHALAGAEVEGHALPAPVVDMRLDGDERLDARVIAQLLVVALDELAADRAAEILAGDGLLARTSSGVMGRSERNTLAFSSRIVGDLSKRAGGSIAMSASSWRM